VLSRYLTEVSKLFASVNGGIATVAGWFTAMAWGITAFIEQITTVFA
jgi:hypothetical protein